MRRVIVSVLLSLIAFPTAAPSVLAVGGACLDSNYVFSDPHPNTWVFVDKDPSGGSTTWVNSIKAATYVASGYFYPCTTSGSADDGPSAWVAIVPGSGSSHAGDFNAILQIGVIRCTVTLPACSGRSGGPRYWYTDAGCNLHWPIPQDLGAATYGTHTYEISPSGAYFALKVDTVTKALLSPNASGMGCWTDEDTKAQWADERFDHGDSVGSNGSTSQRAQFSSMGYATPALNAWLDPNVTSCINTYPSGTGRYVCSSGNNPSWFHAWNIY